jgi:hypothetical protein
MKTVKMMVLMMALLVSVNISAQNLHFGAKAGLNLGVQSKIADYYNDNNMRAAYNAGVFGNYSINKSFTFQTELNYNQEGSKSENTVNKYDYISLPLMVKYSLGTSNLTGLRFNAFVGPDFSYLVNAQSEITSDGVKSTIDNKEISNNFQMGAVTGFGVEYPIGNHAILFDVRLGLGFTKYNDAISGANNKIGSFSLGYQF